MGRVHVTESIEQFGSLHVVVNNAGLMSTEIVVEVNGAGYQSRALKSL